MSAGKHKSFFVSGTLTTKKCYVFRAINMSFDVLIHLIYDYGRDPSWSSVCSHITCAFYFLRSTHAFNAIVIHNFVIQ